MFKKTILAGAVATALITPGLASAAESPHSLTGNVGLYSQYIFRGISQTFADPALQGGLDYSHSSGLYVGTWGSNISWLTDAAAYSSSSLELDFYGGFRGAFGKSDFGYDVGLLYYYYPGNVNPGFTKADTLEAYGALSWKWLSAKYSYSLNNKTFGVADSKGTWYFDLTASVPLGSTGLTGIAHWGKQKYSGSPGGVSNDSFASYEDWKIGVNYALPKDFTVGVFYSDTSMNATQKGNYTVNGRFLGKDTVTVFLQKTF